MARVRVDTKGTETMQALEREREAAMVADLIAVVSAVEVVGTRGLGRGQGRGQAKGQAKADGGWTLAQSGRRSAGFSATARSPSARSCTSSRV